MPDDTGSSTDSGFLQRLDIEQILRAAGSDLVPEELRLSDDRNSQSAVDRRDAALPGLVERHSIDRRQHIDAIRRDAHLENGSRCREIPSGEIAERCAESL